jgi:hypothetical protein
MKAPDQPPPADKPTCGNCCNATRSSRAVGRVICTALPPHLIVNRGMATNVWPELDAGKLGCTVLWNVSAQLFHILASAVTLAAQPGANDGQQQVPEKGSDSPGGRAGG